MPGSAFDQPRVLLLALVAGFLDDSGDVLHCVSGPGLLAARDLGSGCPETATVLALVVERRYNNVAAFTLFWVVAVVPHDETPDAVILGIYLWHSMSVRLDQRPLPDMPQIVRIAVGSGLSLGALPDGGGPTHRPAAGLRDEGNEVPV